MKAFDFNLPDQNGNLHNLSGYRGKWVILYFYPKDDTPGCTKEACNFRDNVNEFEKMGAVIIGVSKDSVASHKKFADKYNLNFILLSDPEHNVIEEYGSWIKQKFMGKEYYGTSRDTYIINPEGNIVKTYKKINPLTSVKEILSGLEGLKS